ncbi:MAG: hypothetical protein LLG02_06800 [Pelosinus sp.]|nr:hypothetical protein [Pelosinus sp.]
MVGWCSCLAIVIICQRMVELYIARKNRSWSLAAGAREFGARHYPLFFIVHIGWFISWITESCLWGAVSAYWYIWLSLFIMAQGLRYWCMVSLGRHWNTRILVIPGEFAVCKGPYRFIAHPNYAAVAFEIFCVPLIFGAVITATIVTFLNAILILGIRLPAERNALRLLKQEHSVYD